MLFDTVYISPWKHFNAGSGMILTRDAALIALLQADRRFSFEKL